MFETFERQYLNKLVQRLCVPRDVSSPQGSASRKRVLLKSNRIPICSRIGTSDECSRFRMYHDGLRTSWTTPITNELEFMSSFSLNHPLVSEGKSGSLTEGHWNRCAESWIPSGSANSASAGQRPLPAGSSRNQSCG